MQSYKTRIGDKQEQFLEFVKDYGLWEAMGEFDLHDVVAVRKLLKEWTGDENFGINPRVGELGAVGNEDVFEIVRKRLENFVADAERRDKAKDMKIAELEEALDTYKRDNYKLYGNKLLQIIDTLPNYRYNK